jgi:hypothetical protein
MKSWLMRFRYYTINWYALIHQSEWLTLWNNFRKIIRMTLWHLTLACSDSLQVIIPFKQLTNIRYSQSFISQPCHVIGVILQKQQFHCIVQNSIFTHEDYDLDVTGSQTKICLIYLCGAFYEHSTPSHINSCFDTIRM